MLRATKLEDSKQAQEYYRKDFSNSQQTYYSQDQAAAGEFGGRLAADTGLHGQVTAEQFARLTEGQDALTGEQLVRHVTPHERILPNGETERTNAHVPGWDLTFSAPKSHSAQAVYGGNPEVRQALRKAHRDAVKTAMEKYEEYAMARMGGSKQPERTGKLLTVSFEHDTSRPEGGVASPQLHTHVIAMNMTRTADGKMHSLQTEGMYEAQRFARVVYHSELAHNVRAIGFELERGLYGEPEIKGISREYIDEISYRTNSINERAAQSGYYGPRARDIHALQTRKSKQEIDVEKTELTIREAAQRHGIDFAKLEREALQRGPQLTSENELRQQVREALNYACEHHAERSATFRQDQLVADALYRGMGSVRCDDVLREVAQRRESGEYVVRRVARTSAVLTTREMQQKEQETICKMRQGQGQAEPFRRDTAALLKEVHQSPALHRKGLTLNDAQERVFHEVMSNTDQIQAINGFAGSGKTSALGAMKIGWEAEGYTVKGFGTTGKNTHQLAETGMQVETLASHLQKGDKAHQHEGKVVYVLDESSMASTAQAHQFLTGLRTNERVVLVGDTRQHQSVGWGKPFEQLQDAGMHTAELDKIVRQKNLVLEEMVYRLERGDVAGAIQIGRENHVFVEEKDPQKRLDYITEQALQYREAAQERRPGETARQHEARQRIILVTPENTRKQEINETLRVKMQQRGMIGKEDYQINVLVARQDVTKAQKTWAETYEIGERLKYYKANRELGIGKDDHARVIARDAERNTITVEFEGGKKRGRQLTYDPSKGGNGVAIYRETGRTFSPGQEVQFTAKAKLDGAEIKNRDLGKFQSMDEQGNITIRHENGREVRFHATEYRHLEQGGCYTSQIAQGQTAGMSGGDFGAKNPDLVTFRATLITASRAQYECKIVAPDLAEMERLIQREISNETALPESRYRQAQEPRRSYLEELQEFTRQGATYQPPGQTARAAAEMRRELEAILPPERTSRAPSRQQAQRQAEDAHRSLAGTLYRERAREAVSKGLAPTAEHGQGQGVQPGQGHGQGEGLAPGGEGEGRGREIQQEQKQQHGFEISI